MFFNRSPKRKCSNNELRRQFTVTQTLYLTENTESIPTPKLLPHKAEHTGTKYFESPILPLKLPSLKNNPNFLLPNAKLRGRRAQAREPTAQQLAVPLKRLVGDFVAYLSKIQKTIKKSKTFWAFKIFIKKTTVNIICHFNKSICRH